MTTITQPPVKRHTQRNNPISFTTRVAPIRNLLAYTGEVNDLQRALALASWDRETQMPAGGIAVRGTMMTTLAAVIHERATTPKLGRLIEMAERALTDDPERFTLADHALVRESRRDFAIAQKLPDRFVRAQSEARTASWQAWRTAKASADFRQFVPALERVVELCREEAALLDPQAPPYAVLFDLFEPGMALSDCQQILERVRQATVPLVQRIQAARPIDASSIHGRFPEAQQMAIARTMLETMGYQFQNGRIDLTAHPFETSLGSPYDVRVTTRYNYRDVGRVFMPAIHEGGHALYELGVDPALTGSILARGTSLGLHESQSRGWENIIGRSAAFWQAHYHKVQSAFPGTFDHVTVAQFVRALNAVEAQPIRVEADELTYNLHIAIRFELEQEIIAGRLRVADVRDAWNAKYQEYLGVTPQDDAEGVLQDIHWSQGSFGYFSTYSLGNFYAAQFMHQVRQIFPDMDERLAAGETSFIREWQREQIHRWGKIFRASELCERVTGETLNPDHFIRYVTAKYADLYDLR